MSDYEALDDPFDDNRLRELQEEAHRIRELQQQPAWQDLVRFVSRMTDSKTRWLLNGNAKTLEDYRWEAGWVAGATYILQAPTQADLRVERMMSARAELETLRG